MSVIYLTFGSIAKLHNNSKLTVSPIGELSNRARTYAKDPAVFTSDTTGSEVALEVFLADRDGADITTTQTVAELMIGIGDWLYAQAMAGNISNNVVNTLASLQAQFSTDITVSSIGEMVTNNQIWFPSYVTGQLVSNSETQNYTIWFSDPYFRSQYPEVTFTIVHPIPLAEMDTLMSMNYQQIEDRFQRETPDIIEQRTHTLTDQAEWPYTERSVVSFKIYDLINTPKFNLGYWRYVTWGNGVDAQDQLYEQIKNEILKDSQYTEAQWEEKIPDLFNAMEFYIIPYFDQYGLTNRTTGARTYSPITDRETMMDLVDKYFTPTYGSAHVIKSLQFVPFLYKSTECAFLGKPTNQNGMIKIKSMVPDYQLIPATDSDFDLMSPDTANFIKQMESLIAAAESVTPASLLPAGISRVTRNGQLCVANRAGNAKCIMLTKWQMIQDGIIIE